MIDNVVVEKFLAVSSEMEYLFFLFLGIKIKRAILRFDIKADKIWFLTMLRTVCL